MICHRLRSWAADGRKASDGYYGDVDHPINAYRLINRYVAHWKKAYANAFNFTNYERKLLASTTDYLLELGHKPYISVALELSYDTLVSLAYLYHYH